MSALSRSDIREAEMAGRAAVHYAMEGYSDQMVTLERDPDAKYSCTTGLAPLEKVAGQVKVMPAEYLDPANYWVTRPFVDYARPLIGSPLPRVESII